MSSRNPPVDQIHNLMSCFDDKNTKGIAVSDAPAYRMKVSGSKSALRCWTEAGRQSIRCLKLKTPVRRQEHANFGMDVAKKIDRGLGTGKRKLIAVVKQSMKVHNSLFSPNYHQLSYALTNGKNCHRLSRRI